MLDQVQREAALLRSARFKEIDANFGEYDQNALMTEISQSMINEMLLVFSTLPGLESPIPLDLVFSLEKITTAAYQWNCTAKRDVLEYNREPFSPPPRSFWNADFMVPFETTGVEDGSCRKDRFSCIFGTCCVGSA